jgi:hypothetical protein
LVTTKAKAENSAARNLQRVQALMPLSGQVVFFGFRSAVPFPRVWWLIDPWMMSKIGDPRNVKGWWDEAAGSLWRTQNNVENFRIALLDALFMTWKANSLHVKWLPKTCQPVLVFYWKHTHTIVYKLFFRPSDFQSRKDCSREVWKPDHQAILWVPTGSQHRISQDHTYRTYIIHINML